jgi:hypothetical protein
VESRTTKFGSSQKKRTTKFGIAVLSLSGFGALWECPLRRSPILGLRSLRWQTAAGIAAAEASGLLTEAEVVR